MGLYSLFVIRVISKWMEVYSESVWWLENGVELSLYVKVGCFIENIIFLVFILLKWNDCKMKI